MSQRLPCVNTRSCLALLGCICGLAFAVSAVAQPPVFPAIDHNGVDVVTGEFNYSHTGVVIGQPGAGGLAFTRYYRPGSTNNQWSGWTNNQIGYIVPNGATCSVVLGVSVETFTATESDCLGTFTSDQRRGATLYFDSTNKVYTFTGSDGTAAEFIRPSDGVPVSIQGIPSSMVGYVLTVTRPDGEVIHYGYEFGTFCSPDPQTCYFTYKSGRLQSVSNNLGYRLVFEYPVPNPSYPVDYSAPPSKITGISTSKEYCNGWDCSLQWMSATYTYDSNGNLTGATDGLGNTTSYSYSGYNLTKIQFPDAAAHAVNIAYSSNGVTSIDRGFGLWSYSYVDANGKRTTTVTNPDSTTRVYVSDLANGRIDSFTNELGETLGYQYDSAARRTKVTEPAGNYTQYTYDSRGNITQTLKVSATPGTPANIVTSATYPAFCTNPVICNKPTSTTDARGYDTDYTYDSTHGGVLSVTAPATTGGARPQTLYTYAQFQARYQSSYGTWTNGPAVWRLTQVSTCATQTTCVGTVNETAKTINYPGASTPNNLQPTSITTAAGDGSVSVTRTMTYTNWGDVLTVDGPLSGAADTTRYYYDADRQLIGEVGPNPDGGGPLLYRAVRKTYNAIGQPAVVEGGTVSNQADGAFSSFAVLEKQDTVYDGYARPIESRLWNGGSIAALTQYSYDNRGRLLCTAVRMNPTSFTGPPSNACAVGGAGAFGPDRITHRVYDDAGHVLAQQSAYGTALQQTTAAFTYTPNGQVATRTDARGYLTSYEYDGLGRLRIRRYPDPDSLGQSSTTDYEQFTYDAAGDVTVERLRSGEQVSLGYDNLGDLTSRDLPGSQPDVTYGYDLLGHMISASQTGETITRQYDALSRLESETSSELGTVSYKYDAAGRRRQITFPDGFYVTYVYDTSDLTGILENGATPLATYGYDNLGRRTSLTRGNGVVTSYAYAAASRLASLVQDPSGSSYDTSFSFGYNPAGQMTSRADSNAVYEPAVLAGSSESYAADGLNRYTSARGVMPTYDARGNLTSDGTKTYGYDYDNRLTSASGGVSLDYDPLGRLHEVVASATTRFLYDGGNVIAEYDTSGNVLKRYVYGPGVDEPLVSYEGSGTSNREWLLADERGSVIGITDGAGNVTQVNKYDALGVPDAGNEGRFQYTGQMWIAELGLYDYKARAYDPELGRFMQTDPIGYAGGGNLYGYAGNDPVNRTDPSGLFCVAWGTIGSWSDYQETGAGFTVNGHNISGCIYDVPVPYIGPPPSHPPVSTGAGGGAPASTPVEGGNGVHPPQGNPHNYTIVVPTMCSADDAFDAFKGAGTSAPGAPAAKEGFTPRIMLFDFLFRRTNPISQLVNSSTRTIVNTTRKGHTFYPGSVTIHVDPAPEDTSVITITGVGTGPDPIFNDVIGYLWFGAYSAGNIVRDCQARAGAYYVGP